MTARQLGVGRPGSPRDRWILALILALAFAVRLVAVFQYEARHPNAEHPAIDEASYDGWAREIAGGQWVGKEVYFQEPLYPYALGALYALLGPHRIAARVAQCALWAVATALAGLLARRLFGRAAGFLAALAIALYWPGILFPAFLLKENLFLPLFALFALALVRTRDPASGPGAAWKDRGRWLFVGALAGLGALLRGNMLALLPLFALWPIARAWRLRRPAAPAVVHAGAFLSGSAGVLLPVALRNLAVGGVFLLTTSGAGTNLYGGNNLENPYGRASEPGFVRGIPEHEAGDWRREAERRLARPLDPGEVSAYWRGETLRSFRDHPREHLAILWNKLRLSLGRYEVPDDHCLYWDSFFVPIARVPLPGFGLIGTLGLAGLALFLLHARRGRRSPLVTSLPASFEVADPEAAAEVALVFLLYLGTIVLTVTSDRARLPLVALLAPFAGWTLVWAARAGASRSQDAVVRLALALFLGALAVHARVLPEAEIAEDFDERDYNLAVQRLRDEGRTDEARAIAERLVAEHAKSARARTLLAEIDFRDAAALARTPDAVARRAGRAKLEAVLARVEPLADEPSLNTRERFRAASLCAWIQLERGEWSRAQARFLQALAFDGESRELREGFVRALLGSVESRPEEEGRADTEEALARLRQLRSTASDDPKAPALEILTAQAEFLKGRAMLDALSASDEEKKLGKQSVQTALKRLQRVAGPQRIPADLRRRARLVAGAIQLYLRNWKPAENHYHAAHGPGTDPEADLGLLQAMLGSLEESAKSDDRSRGVVEADRLLRDLRSTDPESPLLEDLGRRLDRVR
jgi:hypothetical protein